MSARLAVSKTDPLDRAEGKHPFKHNDLKPELASMKAFRLIASGFESGKLLISSEVIWCLLLEDELKKEHKEVNEKGFEPIFSD